MNGHLFGTSHRCIEVSEECPILCIAELLAGLFETKYPWLFTLRHLITHPSTYSPTENVPASPRESAQTVQAKYQDVEEKPFWKLLQIPDPTTFIGNEITPQSPADEEKTSAGLAMDHYALIEAHMGCTERKLELECDPPCPPSTTFSPTPVWPAPFSIDDIHTWIDRFVDRQTPTATQCKDDVENVCDSLCDGEPMSDEDYDTDLIKKLAEAESLSEDTVESCLLETPRSGEGYQWRQRSLNRMCELRPSGCNNALRKDARDESNQEISSNSSSDHALSKNPSDSGLSHNRPPPTAPRAMRQLASQVDPSVHSLQPRDSTPLFPSPRSVYGEPDDRDSAHTDTIMFSRNRRRYNDPDESDGGPSMKRRCKNDMSSAQGRYHDDEDWIEAFRKSTGHSPFRPYTANINEIPPEELLKAARCESMQPNWLDLGELHLFRSAASHSARCDLIDYRRLEMFISSHMRLVENAHDDARLRRLLFRTVVYLDCHLGRFRNLSRLTEIMGG